MSKHTPKGAIRLRVEQSEATGEWWVRAVAGNNRIVGTSQESYVNRAHAEHMAGNLVLGGLYEPIVEATSNDQWRWHLVASNGRKVFGAHETLTSKHWALHMAGRIAAGENTGMAA